jgi:cytochrome c-550 PedF
MKEIAIMRNRTIGGIFVASLALAAGAVSTRLRAQADVSVQPVGTSALPDIQPGNDQWIVQNPYRADPAVYATAQRIGKQAYGKNCARCHGPDAVSAGIVPDLRHLDPQESGDEWFITRYHHGLKRDGKVFMPPMGEMLGQKTGWAIRSWLDAKHE